jgi:hypothetical protein
MEDRFPGIHLLAPEIHPGKPDVQISEYIPSLLVRLIVTEITSLVHEL